jgi:phosphate:Na+ symporter
VQSTNGDEGLWSMINFDVLREHPTILAVFAALMAMAIQSSTATIGLVIGLGAAEAVSLRLAVPVVIGANVGLAVTMLIVGWADLESRRLALANLLLKIVVAAAALAALGLIGAALPEPAGPVGFGLAIAAVHTGYNIVVAAAGLPLLGAVTDVMERLVPAPVLGPEEQFGPKYISSGPLPGVRLALGQSQREITHVSEITREMLHGVWAALKAGSEKRARDVGARDDEVDLLDTEIKRFLTKISRDEIGAHDADEQMLQLRYLAELETIGDIIDKNLCNLVIKKIRLRAEFSPEGAEELDDFFQKVAQNAMIAETAFTTRDATLARQLLRHKEVRARPAGPPLRPAQRGPASVPRNQRHPPRSANAPATGQRPPLPRGPRDPPGQPAVGPRGRDRVGCGLTAGRIRSYGFGPLGTPRSSAR